METSRYRRDWDAGAKADWPDTVVGKLSTGASRQGDLSQEDANLDSSAASQTVKTNALIIAAKEAARNPLW